ncbi:hypothetical protein [Kluyvera huaxiensis]|uniref:hypothetical protein n=1 Tax=Kluyvera sp. 142053 TaxID=3160979 RepID=UPI0032E033C4
MSEGVKRTVLFISPSFFGYEKEITKELSLNNNVIFWDERPSNSSFYKVLLRLGLKWLIKKYNNEYYDEHIEKIKDKKIDVVFVLNPEAIDLEILKKIKSVVLNNNSQCDFVIYLWDSVKNKPTVKSILSEFDFKYTFDHDDSTSMGMSFLPLFYSDNIDKIINKKNDYLFCFIGTAHSDRINVVDEILSNNRVSKNFKSYLFFYYPSKFIFLIRNITAKIKVKVNFKALSKNEVIQKMSASEIIIDIHHPKQTGLTMRTLECIGLNKKIITTNESVKKYDFYDPKMICIISRKNVKIPDGFIESQAVGYLNREKYKLSQWLHQIIPSEE